MRMTDSILETPCEKNPGHAKFIPVQDFNISHLPSTYRSCVVLDGISDLSCLTTKICATEVSHERTDTDPYYPFRGRKMTRRGTGLVVSVDDADMGGTCPCRDCSSSESPKKIWGTVIIYTAMHVVFDDSETRMATVDLFDDRIDINEEGEAVRLHCESLINSDVHTGASTILCITHDKLVLNKLKQSLDNFQQFLLRDVKKYQEVQPGLAVIVSHPHGCSKHITVGTWTSRGSRKRKKKTDAKGKVNYHYNVPTCPGSSGAPVFVLGSRSVQSWKSFFAYPHCGELRKKDKMYSKLTERINPGMTMSGHSSGDIMSYEADIVSVEARVIYPLGEVKVCSIWFNKRTVKQEKERLLNESDVDYGHPDTFVLTVVSGQDQHTICVLTDESLTSLYIEYLAAENSLKIVKREEVQNLSTGYGVNVKPSYLSS